ncbi:hypothetical protein LIER_11349 [Lithospermum erythrorhizon]|uniref:Uncharacterized protein n=1 Tax=Lithospermum erythrorhizon TaxID=34254 RepID=A0AAV3PSX1_LITER
MKSKAAPSLAKKLPPKKPKVSVADKVLCPSGKQHALTIGKDRDILKVNLENSSASLKEKKIELTDLKVQLSNEKYIVSSLKKDIRHATRPLMNGSPNMTIFKPSATILLGKDTLRQGQEGQGGFEEDPSQFKGLDYSRDLGLY